MIAHVTSNGHYLVGDGDKGSGDRADSLDGDSVTIIIHKRWHKSGSKSGSVKNVDNHSGNGDKGDGDGDKGSCDGVDDCDGDSGTIVIGK